MADPVRPSTSGPAERISNVIEVTMYRARCAGCATLYDYGDYMAWSSPDSAIEMVLEDYDWRMQDDGRLLCMDCRYKPGGDVFEINEEAARV